MQHTSTAVVHPPQVAPVLSWFIFPALLVGLVTAAMALIATDLPRPAVSSTVLISLIVIVMALERLFPLHDAWNAFPERLDLVLLVANRFLDVAVIGVTLGVLGALEARGVTTLHLWPTRAPLPVQAGLGILLAEALRYALHRLSHRPGLLWQVHQTHHQPTRMYALNGPRLHPGNYAWIAVANTVPMLLLGAELSSVMLASMLTSFFVLFQHANLHLRFDGWNRILATPDVHRAHHATDHAARGVNYGIVLLAFDHVFGTYQTAADPGTEQIGSA